VRGGDMREGGGGGGGGVGGGGIERGGYLGSVKWQALFKAVHVINMSSTCVCYPAGELGGEMHSRQPATFARWLLYCRRWSSTHGRRQHSRIHHGKSPT